MTTPARFPPAVARRPVDILGIIGVVLAAVALLPAIAVLLIGLVPETNAIWWLGIVLIPVLGFAGLIALVLGVIGILVASRRRGRYVLSVIAIALGIVAVFPIAALWFSGAA